MPAVYQLLGFPGTGKYTVARAMIELLEARGEPAALLDNHATANLIWSLVPTERRFDRDVMQRMTELRTVLVQAAGELTGPDHSIVFTNFVPSGQDANVLDPHRRLAEKLEREFVPVVLRCDPDVVLGRVANPDRAARYKLVDAGIARRIMATEMSLPSWPDLVDVDITGLSPSEAAARVIALADGREAPA